MIYLYTDFGLNGPYVGQIQSIFAAHTPGIPVIDLMYDAPSFNIKASAFLLEALSHYLEADSYVLGVVDPGVGHPQRKPVMIRADQFWFVGPDNGLFSRVMQNASKLACYELIPAKNISTSFHGRDVFAPALAQLASGSLPDSVSISPEEMCNPDWGKDLAEVIYLDHYGNAMTGIGADSLQQNSILEVDGQRLEYAETFSSVEQSGLFWYKNSIGLVEISSNLNNAAAILGLGIGSKVKVL